MKKIEGEKHNLKTEIMATINPYLTFKGNCEEAFNFYRSVGKHLLGRLFWHLHGQVRNQLDGEF